MDVNDSPLTSPRIQEPRRRELLAFALSGVLIVAMLGLFAAVKTLPGAEWGAPRTVVMTPDELRKDIEHLSYKRPWGSNFNSLRPGDTLVLRGTITDVAASDRGPRLAIGSMSVLALGGNAADYAVNSTLEVTLSVKRMYSPLMNVEVEWFAEDRNPNLPDSDLYVEARHLAVRPAG